MAPGVDIPALVRRLHSRSRVQQLDAAKRIRAMVALRPEGRQAIAAAGGIEALAQLLHSSSSNAVILEPALAALAGLCRDHDSGVAAATAGRLPHLVRLLAQLPQRGSSGQRC